MRRRLLSRDVLQDAVNHVRPGDVGDHAQPAATIDPPRRLVHTFRPVFGEFENEAPSQVEYTLEQLDGSVKLTVLHDHFPPNSAVHRACSNGWPMVLSGLKTVVETGKPLPGVMPAP